MISVTRKNNLVRSLEKLEIYQELQNEMGRTIVAFNFKQPDQVLSHFAMEKEDVSLEYADEGVFKGKDAVTQIINETLGREKVPGEMLDLQLTTPMIEVAEDLQTAKAVWWCPGAGTLVQDRAEPEAVWVWGMLGVDFIVCNGEWKIWHLHYFRFIKCNYQKGWVEDISMINRMNAPLHPASQPTTYHNPYSPLSIREGIPICPRPYKKHEGNSNWMIHKD